MAKPHTAIIIVNWNGKKDTLNLLSSLAGLNRRQGTLTVIVVDNASVDGSVAAVRESYPDTHVIESGKNLGFAAANNLGLRHAQGLKADFFWILNNDTVADEDALSLEEAFADGKVGAASSKIYFAKGREYHHERYREDERGRVIWYAGGIIDWNNMYASHRGVDEVDHGQYDEPGETGFVTGCSMMVSKEAVARCGMFDERYYLYYEDVDLSIRIKRSGMKTVYVPDSVIWHVNAGSSGGPGNKIHEYYMTRNRLLAGMKYAPLRTKLALVKESVRFISRGGKTRRRAVLDAALLRFGESRWIKSD